MPCLGAQFSQDGALLATWQGDGARRRRAAAAPKSAASTCATGSLTPRRCAVVSVYNARTEEKVIDLGAGEGAVHAVSISPLCAPCVAPPRFFLLTRGRSGTYVQVYHKSAGGEGEKNLKARTAARMFTQACADVAFAFVLLLAAAV